MKKYNLLFILLFSYLIIFAAFSMHRTSSGYRRKFELGNKFKSTDKIHSINQEEDYNEISSIPLQFSKTKDLKQVNFLTFYGS